MQHLMRPQVQLLKPTQDLSEVAPTAAHAHRTSDDHGLGQARLRYVRSAFTESESIQTIPLGQARQDAIASYGGALKN